jgi:membrane-associated phospholipid phosphatase
MSQHRPPSGRRKRQKSPQRLPKMAGPSLTPGFGPSQGEASRPAGSSGPGTRPPDRQDGDDPRAALTGHLWYVWPFVALVSLAFLAAFGDAAHEANLVALQWLQRAVPREASDTLSTLLVLGSTSGSIAVAGVAGAILFARGERRVALALGLLLAGMLIEFALKSWVGHPGIPSIYHRDPRWYPVPDLGASDLELPSPFPSGHAMRTTFLALVGTALVARYLPALATLARVGAGVVVALVAVLLVVMGWHWPTDIAGGLLVGYAIAAPARHLLAARRPLPRRGRGLGG